MTPTILAVLVVVLSFPLNWYVTYRLWRLSRANREIRVLHERATVSTALSLIVTVFALVFVNNSIIVPPLLSLEQTQIITRAAILILTLPALYWLWLYRNGRRD